MRTRSIFLMLVCMSWVAAHSKAAVVASVTSNAPVLPGDPLNVLVTATNTGPDYVDLVFGSPVQAGFSVDGVNIYLGGVAVETHVILAPNGSRSWGLTHDWYYHRLASGPHTLIGLVGQPGQLYAASDPLSIQVLPPIAPTGDFLLDFDQHHDTGAAVESLDRYLRYGVEFRARAVQPKHRLLGENHYIETLRESSPQNAFLHAKFDVPVYGITADVGAARGVAVVMTAKDASGNVLATATSDPVPDANTFLSLSLRADVPIAWIEWVPATDAPSDYVRLDNVLVHVPEPSAFAAMVLGGCCVLRRRARARNKPATIPRAVPSV